MVTDGYGNYKVTVIAAQQSPIETVELRDRYPMRQPDNLDSNSLLSLLSWLFVRETT
jgi:hypothetical protein